MRVVPILSSATATGAGASFDQQGTMATFQATVSGTGSVTSTVDIEVSNDSVNWLVLQTMSLSGTTTATDGIASNAPWGYVRAKVTAISGTSATVNVVMGLANA